MARLRAKSLLKSNVEFWLNDLFLRAGLYRNITNGDTDFYGNPLSRLAPVVGDPKFPDGSVFQSPFKNWVYEPGIPSSTSGVPGPFVASGVFVDGTWYPDSTSGTYAHFIDYPNGRVVFTSPLAGSPVVQTNFAHKTVGVESATKLRNENNDLLIQTAYKDNPSQTGVQIYPNETNRTLPMVWFDFQNRTNSPYELGTRNSVKDYRGVFHIWTHEEFNMDIIEEILSDEHHQVLIGVDYNDAPFPLLAYGRKNPLWPGYRSQADIYGPYFWRRIYLDASEPRQVPPLFEIERTEVSFNIKVYPNF